MNTRFYPGLTTPIVARLLVIWLFVSCSALGVGAEPSGNASEVARTIHQLGSASFVARESATQQLLNLGEAAELALVESSRNPDREIRERSIRVLGLVREQRRTIQLIAFRRGETATAAKQLPGWKVFAERYGDDVFTRKLYARLLQAEWELLEACFTESTSPQIRDSIRKNHERLRGTGLGYPSYSVGTMLTYFFLALEFQDEFELHANLHSFIGHRTMQPLLSPAYKTDVATRTIARKLVGDWLLVASGRHLRNQLALQTTLLYQMHAEGRVLAQRVLTDPEALPSSRSTAMQAIAVRKDKSQLGLIEPFLEDKTLLRSLGKREQQLRDVALACVMQLNGHDVTKIGITPMRNASYSAFDYNTLGFISEAEREKAFKLYRKLQLQKKP